MSEGFRKRKVKKAMVQPVHLLYKFFVGKNRVHIWLYENKNVRIEGVIRGFDEYMNIVLQQAEEINIKKKTKKRIGMIMLKGDNIALLQEGEQREKL